MAKGFWIAHVDVSDPEQYKAYVAADAEPFRHYGAYFWCAQASSSVWKAQADRAMS